MAALLRWHPTLEGDGWREELTTACFITSPSSHHVRSPTFTLSVHLCYMCIHPYSQAEDKEECDGGFAEVAPDEGDISDAGVLDSEPDEVELVQQLVSIEAALADSQQAGRNMGSQQGQQQQQQAEELLELQLRFGSTFCRLPKDLQTVLISSPVRQELLAAAAETLLASSSSSSSCSNKSSSRIGSSSEAGKQQQSDAGTAAGVGAHLQQLLVDLLQTVAERA